MKRIINLHEICNKKWCIEKYDRHLNLAYVVEKNVNSLSLVSIIFTWKNWSSEEKKNVSITFMGIFLSKYDDPTHCMLT